MSSYPLKTYNASLRRPVASPTPGTRSLHEQSLPGNRLADQMTGAVPPTSHSPFLAQGPQLTPSVPNQPRPLPTMDAGTAYISTQPPRLPPQAAFVPRPNIGPTFDGNGAPNFGAQAVADANALALNMRALAVQQSMQGGTARLARFRPIDGHVYNLGFGLAGMSRAEFDGIVRDLRQMIDNEPRNYTFLEYLCCTCLCMEASIDQSHFNPLLRGYLERLNDSCLQRGINVAWQMTNEFGLGIHVEAYAT